MTEHMFPRWIWADPDGLRAEVTEGLFVDYVRRDGVWRQQTRPMTHAESVSPASCWLGDWRDGTDRWPVVDDDTAAWLDKTMKEISR